MSAYTIEPDTDSYHRAVRHGDDTIGYIAARGRQAHLAWDARFQPIETGADSHGMWYAPEGAVLAVINAHNAARSQA